MLAIAVARHLDDHLAAVDYDEAGGNTFINEMPSTPDDAISVSDSGGFAQPSKAPTDLPTVQIRVRGGRDPRPSRVLAEAISGELACLDHVTLDDGGDDEVFVVGCTPLQSAPSPLGLDENQRHEWTQNFAFRVHAPTVHRT